MKGVLLPATGFSVPVVLVALAAITGCSGSVDQSSAIPEPAASSPLVSTTSTTEQDSAEAGPTPSPTPTAGAGRGAGSIAAPRSGSRVRGCEVLSGTARFAVGRTLMVGMRNLDNQDPTWYAERVHSQPAAGSEGRWTATQYFGSGDSSVGQRYEVRLVAVTTTAVDGLADAADRGTLIPSAERLATARYTRVAGRCPDR